jgi:lipoprotein-anchoring transpeptidase ErfK/SrfK
MSWNLGKGVPTGRVFASLEEAVMKGFGWIGVGVGLFLGAVVLAVVTDSLEPAAEPAPVAWATVLPEGALSKIGSVSIPNDKHAAAVGKVRRLVVSIPGRKLVLVADGKVVKVYRVAVGAKVSPSPRGEFRIAVRIPEATYYHAGVVIPSGEQSPIGTRWIGLNQAGFGIHGTNAPRSIGKAASHGCIRMRNRDAEELFEMVRVGDVVEIRDEEVAELVAANGDGSSGGE